MTISPEKIMRSSQLSGLGGGVQTAAIVVTVTVRGGTLGASLGGGLLVCLSILFQRQFHFCVQVAFGRFIATTTSRRIADHGA
jgi:hypothetical protein